MINVYVFKVRTCLGTQRIVAGDAATAAAVYYTREAEIRNSFDEEDGDTEADDYAAETAEDVRRMAPIVEIKRGRKVIIAEAVFPEQGPTVTIPEPLGCHAGRDGDCVWERCPQNRDDEPGSTGRHCPLDIAFPEGDE